MNNPTQSSVLFLRAPLELSVAGRDESAKPLPLGLEGYPTHVDIKVGDELKRLPVAYFEKDVLETGHYADEKTRQEFDVTESHLDSWADSFNKMRAAGTEVHCPVDHSDKAEDNRGFAIKLRRDGNKLKTTMQVFGEDGALMALRNRCSVKINPNYIDEKKRNWGNVIEHVSFTPVPVIRGQGPFVPIAASRGEQSTTPILYLSAPNKESIMDLKALRETIGAAKEVTDEQVIIQAVAKLGELKPLELSRTNAETALATMKTRAETAEASLATAQGKVLELSRAPDPGILADRAELMRQKIDLAMDKGQCVKAQADILKAALMDGDKPNVLMLSRSGASGTPIDVALKVLELNKAFTGTVTDMQRQDDPSNPAPITEARKKEIMAMHGYSPK